MDDKHSSTESDTFRPYVPLVAVDIESPDDTGSECSRAEKFVLPFKGRHRKRSSKGERLLSPPAKLSRNTESCNAYRKACNTNTKDCHLSHHLDDTLPLVAVDIESPDDTGSECSSAEKFVFPFKGRHRKRSSKGERFLSPPAKLSRNTESRNAYRKACNANTKDCQLSCHLDDTYSSTESDTFRPYVPLVAVDIESPDDSGSECSRAEKFVLPFKGRHRKRSSKGQRFLSPPAKLPRNPESRNAYRKACNANTKDCQLSCHLDDTYSSTESDTFRPYVPLVAVDIESPDDSGSECSRAEKFVLPFKGRHRKRSSKGQRLLAPPA